jgi:hypothetical protein
MHCGKCQQPTTPSDSIVLWDNRTYCRSCVEAVSPELFLYAADHPSFQEEVPFPKKQLVRRHLFFSLKFGIGVGVLAAVFLYSSIGFLNSLFVLLVTITLGLLVFAIQVFPNIWAAGAALPSITIVNGTVEIRRKVPLGRPTPIVQVWPLEQVRWSTGTPQHDSMLSNLHFPKTPVIILEREGERVACGWTSDSQKLLIAFFELAGTKPRIRGLFS